MNSLESRLLLHADQILDDAILESLPGQELTAARLSLLELVSAIYAGRDPNEYWRRTQPTSSFPFSVLPMEWAKKVLHALEATEIPVPLALSALSREVLSPSQQRTTGAYYTDWRLAQLLAAQGVAAVKREGIWVDPACGTGILLVAAAMTRAEGRERDEVIRNQLAGADLSSFALRGTLLAVASLSQDMGAIDAFSKRLLQHDSLRSSAAWTELAPEGVALAIANPPWEKLKISRHEVAQSLGATRLYGQKFDQEVDTVRARQDLLTYIEGVVTGTRLQGKGEHDLYKLFLELGIGLAAEDGVLALLVPAGLIRAQGTEVLRQELDEVSTHLAVNVLENRARHFAIDTRFKFVALIARIGSGEKQPIELRVANRAGSLPEIAVPVNRAELVEIRADRSLPEVRTPAEWDLFARLTRSAKTVGDPSGPWHPDYRRELDMTSDREHFLTQPGPDTLAVLEGRHVNQFRWRAKTYVSGQGRAAIWNPEPIATARIRSQWHVKRDALNSDSEERTKHSRVGFCDITGQTNERSLLVARIPSGYVCGNKVPTLSFKAGGEDREDLFVALSNSLVVDWMLRRVVTTSVNFFLLNSLPLPAIDEISPRAMEIIGLSRQIAAAEGDLTTKLSDVGQWRACLDAHVASVWGLDVKDMAIVLNDFPLLDRGQPTLPGEKASTVTRDTVLAALAVAHGSAHPSIGRAEAARRAGAIPYVGAEYV